MKTLNTNLLMIIFLGTGLLSNTMAQAPEGIIYQAEARDGQGRIYAKQKLDVMITIIQDDTNGFVAYEEWHRVTTSEYGIFSLIIGQGDNPKGWVFADIDWGHHPYFLNVQVEDPKKGKMTDMGTSQLLSVPYALHAKTAETALGSISESDPVFNAWDKSTGIAITESQISDLQNYLTTETDPTVSANFDFSGAATGDLL